MTNDCKTCPVSTGTHKPAEAVHQIDEPQAEALRLADDCEESATHWVHEIDTRAKAAKMLRAQHARIAELEQRLEIDPRHRYDGISARDATIKAQDERIAELEAELAAVQQGVQQALYTVIGESGCALPQYSANTEQGVIHNVLAVARNEGYKGDGITRLMELGWKVRPVYTHPTQQGLDSKLLSLDSDLLVEARRALWCLSQDYEDGELRLRAQEHLERIDERRCVGRENIFNSHAAIAAQAKQGAE